ncbi:MAG: hypothetical protein M1824_006324 [Vezdaea acicularis]|nr:MAG: hypothetical protein M1824_006324 [Vezdaea acicularis]
MPPTSPQSETNVDLHQQNALTDHDVEVLHSIITAAQTRPEAAQKPFQALFEAYNNVLRDIGLEPDHDRLYFRLLLRVAGVSGNGSLYQKFEALLDEMGIRLEFDEEGDAPPDFTKEIGTPVVARELLEEQENSPRGRTRRNSFNSMYDAGDESTRQIHRRARSQSTMSRPETGASMFNDGRPSTRPTTRTTERASSQDANLRKRPLLMGSRVRSNGLASKEQDYASIVSEESSPSENLAPGGPLIYPSQAQLSSYADMLHRSHIERIATRILRGWSYQANQVAVYHRHLALRAKNYDRGTLLKQALEIWKENMRDQRQAREIDRYFARIERRADKARDLYLLTKAFTHWAQLAYEETQRTSTARRHMLRTRYFNAWRDITVVNQLKVYRHGLKRCFGLWRSKLETIRTNATQAVAIYQHNLVQNVYWRWFWSFCGQRAPQWYGERRKRRALVNWVNAFRERKEREGWVENIWRLKVQGNTLALLTQRSRFLRERLQAAADHSQRRTIREHFLIWRKQTFLAPAARYVSAVGNGRVLRNTIRQWLHVTRLNQYAAYTNHSRILRNAWTTWNDRLRYQTLVDQINERVILEAMYKWVLAERYALIKRTSERRLVEKTFVTLVQKWKSRQAESSRIEDTIKDDRDRKLLRGLLGRWKLQMDLQAQRRRLAREFYAPGVLQRALSTWVEKSQYLRQLDERADLARFFFLTKSSITRWQEALTKSKREKRRSAYAVIRRKVKINLATKVLLAWREHTAHQLDIEHQAEAVFANRLVIVGMNCFDSWRARTDELAEMTRECQLYRVQSLERIHFNLWVSRLNRHREMVNRATELDHLHIANVAAVQLRKFGMRAFEIKTRIRSAQDLQERNTRKHYRSMLRYWRDLAQARQRRQSSSQTAVQSSEDANQDQGIPESVLGATRRAEDWTAFDDTFDPAEFAPGLGFQPTSTPRAVYLSTPSKRAAYTRALARPSTTPVGTPPLTRNTTLLQRLRAQATSTPGVWGSRLGRSGLSRPREPLEDVREASSTFLAEEDERED